MLFKNRFFVSEFRELWVSRNESILDRLLDLRSTIICLQVFWSQFWDDFIDICILVKVNVIVIFEYDIDGCFRNFVFSFWVRNSGCTMKNLSECMRRDLAMLAIRLTNFLEQITGETVHLLHFLSSTLLVVIVVSSLQCCYFSIVGFSRFYFIFVIGIFSLLWFLVANMSMVFG